MAPLLDIPGKSAIAWNKPIIKASLYVISFSSFVPFLFFTMNNAKAVTRSAIPTYFTFSLISSILSFKSNPRSPAGIVPTTIKSAYLKFW